MSELTALANEKVSIVEVCNILGMEVFEGGNFKFYCPFGHLFHKDGGASKAFKLYPESNSAYCFACPMYFTPTRLMGMDKSLEDEEAAEYLLQLVGYVPPTLDARWEDARTVVVEIDTDGLSTALSLYCRRIDPDWETNQFEEPVATIFRKCIELTSRVRTDEDATLWLNQTKEVMRSHLAK